MPSSGRPGTWGTYFRVATWQRKWLRATALLTSEHALRDMAKSGVVKLWRLEQVLGNDKVRIKAFMDGDEDAFFSE